MSLPVSNHSRVDGLDNVRAPSQRRSSRLRVVLIIAAAGILLVMVFPLAVTLIAPRLMHFVGQPNQKVAASEAAAIGNQLQVYLADNGLTRPTTGMTLSVLTQGSTPYLTPADLLDPWGRPYLLVVPGQGVAAFNIVSYGFDGMLGGEGPDADIVR